MPGKIDKLSGVGIVPEQAKAIVSLVSGGSSTAIVALTNNTGGTVSNTLADVPSTYTEATLANQLASLAAKVNELVTFVNSLKAQ